MSEATAHMTTLVREMIDEEDLTDEEREAADDLLTLFANATEIGSDEMKRMKRPLSKIPKAKRARHGLGWDL